MHKCCIKYISGSFTTLTMVVFYTLFLQELLKMNVIDVHQICKNTSKSLLENWTKALKSYWKHKFNIKNSLTLLYTSIGGIGSKIKTDLLFNILGRFGELIPQIPEAESPYIALQRVFYFQTVSYKVHCLGYISQYFWSDLVQLYREIEAESLLTLSLLSSGLTGELKAVACL